MDNTRGGRKGGGRKGAKTLWHSFFTAEDPEGEGEKGRSSPPVAERERGLETWLSTFPIGGTIGRKGGGGERGRGHFSRTLCLFFCERKRGEDPRSSGKIGQGGEPGFFPLLTRKTSPLFFRKRKLIYTSFLALGREGGGGRKKGGGVEEAAVRLASYAKRRGGGEPNLKTVVAVG